MYLYLINYNKNMIAYIFHILRTQITIKIEYVKIQPTDSDIVISIILLFLIVIGYLRQYLVNYLNKC